MRSPTPSPVLLRPHPQLSSSDAPLTSSSYNLSVKADPNSGERHCPLETTARHANHQSQSAVVVDERWSEVQRRCCDTGQPRVDDRLRFLGPLSSSFRSFCSYNQSKSVASPSFLYHHMLPSLSSHQVHKPRRGVHLLSFFLRARELEGGAERWTIQDKRSYPTYKLLKSKTSSRLGGKSTFWRKTCFFKVRSPLPPPFFFLPLPYVNRHRRPLLRQRLTDKTILMDFDLKKKLKN